MIIKIKISTNSNFLGGGIAKSEEKKQLEDLNALKFWLLVHLYLHQKEDVCLDLYISL